MSMEVIRMIRQLGLIQRLCDGLNLTQVEAVLPLLEPTVRLLAIFWMECMGRGRQVLTGMVPIHDLHTVWKQIGCQIPLA